MLKPNGVLGYITPNTYLTNKYIKPLRQFILDNCTVHTIVNHDKVFTAASVDTATIIMSKVTSDDNTVTVLQSSKFVFEEICKKQQADWRKDSDLVFNINKQDIAAFTNCTTLGEICKTYFGIQAYDRKTSISVTPLSDKYLPFIDGADIHPYSYAVPKIYFDYRPENIKSGGDWDVYSRDRIVIRQIGQIPVVGLCKANILASNTLYSVYTKDEGYDLLFLLACLSSTFIQNYWRAKYSDNKALFPKIKGFQLKELPIPVVTSEQQEPVVSIVEQLISQRAADPDCNIEELEKQMNALVDSLYTQIG